MAAFGGYKNFIDVMRDGDWDLIWNVAQLYVDGDLF
jgi:hypothetical protein